MALTKYQTVVSCCKSPAVLKLGKHKHDSELSVLSVSAPVCLLLECSSIAQPVIFVRIPSEGIAIKAKQAQPVAETLELL